MSALRGRRIVVTRPRARAASLCAALTARGAVVIACPVIETVALAGGELDAALRDVARYDWIALTSAAAVEALCERRDALGLGPVEVPVAAVGPATRDAAVAVGFEVRAVPATYKGSELAAAMLPLSGRRVLLPASTIARPQTAAALRAAGARVDEVFAYETRTMAPPAETLAALRAGADVITFASPSAVAAFSDLTGEVGRSLLHSAVIACIGPTTAAAARAAGLEVRVEPASYTAVHLVAALESWFEPAAFAEGVL